MHPEIQSFRPNDGASLSDLDSLVPRLTVVDQLAVPTIANKKPRRSSPNLAWKKCTPRISTRSPRVLLTPGKKSGESTVLEFSEFRLAQSAGSKRHDRNTPRVGRQGFCRRCHRTEKPCAPDRQGHRRYELHSSLQDPGLQPTFPVRRSTRPSRGSLLANYSRSVCLCRLTWKASAAPIFRARNSARFPAACR